jgi:hypothetical protein
MMIYGRSAACQIISLTKKMYRMPWRGKHANIGTNKQQFAENIVARAKPKFQLRR